MGGKIKIEKELDDKLHTCERKRKKQPNHEYQLKETYYNGRFFKSKNYSWSS